MKLRPKITQPVEYVPLTTNHQLVRIGLDTYTLQEKSNGSHLKSVTFKCEKFSALINNINGDIIHIGISQKHVGHLKLTLEIDDGREIVYDSSKPYKGHTGRKGPISFEVKRWLTNLPNRCPFDRILTDEQFASRIRALTNTSVKQALIEIWAEIHADAQSRSTQNGNKFIHIKGAHASYIYMTLKCGRVILMLSSAD
jgi:hypothetical protein